ncbi:MAG: DUF4157 domain-containing protein [Treponema sp.]|uniref:eCIS core domain-containing protein n=1 Tax=Treponema sp. TaxID=166 RepID=UPI0025EE7C53|nr:DUF4157 domain-containing protein [Treponema sp.]MBQ8678970.1 DUF4157 domain-containing protein [Treponema sp.]
MADFNTDRQATFQELVDSGQSEAVLIDEIVKNAIELAEGLKCNPLTKKDTPSPKKEAEFAEYQNEESFAIRSWRYDREHQLDRVIVNGFNKKNDTDIESVKIIYGPGANEYTRSHHALALAVADRIYFRNGAYKPETEEGRKLLAHELTHIAQNKNKNDLRNAKRSELEEQAEQNEGQAVYNPDPNVTIKYRGKYITMRESQMSKFADKIAKEILEEVDGMERAMSDADYLKYLIDFSEKVKSGEAAWLN